MISNLKYKEPIDSSLAKSAISIEGSGSLSPLLAFGFEAHLSETISKSSKLLRTLINNKLKAVKPANIRNKKWIGKKFNTMFGIDSECIELSGTELLAVMKFIKEDVDIDIHPKAAYRVSIGEAERIQSRLNQIDTAPL